MRQEVQTIDEGVHLSAGVSYWLTRDFRLNEEHPPLIKLIAALPVVLSHPNVPLNSESWKNADEWTFAQDFLYHSGNNADQILFLGRLGMVAVSLVLGLVLYLWGRKLAGDWGGIITLGWYALDPNFLAHGRLVTTDVGVTLACAATLYFLIRLLECWNWKRLLVFGVVFGFSQVTKFSAIYLFPMCFAICFIWFVFKTPRQWKHIFKRSFALLGISVACSAIIIFTTYMGQVKAGKNDAWIQSLFQERAQVVTEQLVSTKPPLVKKIIHLTDPNTHIGKFITSVVRDVPIPAWSFFKGIAQVANHDYWGHLSYLNGQYSNSGWWWYFPEAFFIKTFLLL